MMFILRKLLDVICFIYTTRNMASSFNQTAADSDPSKNRASRPSTSTSPLGIVTVSTASTLEDGIPSCDKPRTQEEIRKLVEEGAKNYPTYLKLIYTGDSEQSSEDEFSTTATGIRSGEWNENGFCLAYNAQQLNLMMPSLKQVGEAVTHGHRSSSEMFGLSPPLVGGCPLCAGGISPESNKLEDPGREKVSTPVVECIQHFKHSACLTTDRLRGKKCDLYIPSVGYIPVYGRVCVCVCPHHGRMNTPPLPHAVLFPGT